MIWLAESATTSETRQPELASVGITEPQAKEKLGEDNVEHPMQTVLDAPMAAHRVQNPGGIIG